MSYNYCGDCEVEALSRIGIEEMIPFDEDGIDMDAINEELYGPKTNTTAACMKELCKTAYPLTDKKLKAVN